MMHEKTIAASAFLAAAFVSTIARAETKPAVVWIPTTPVDVLPSAAFDTQCSKVSLSGSAVASGCLANIDEATTLTPHANVQQIVDGVAAAFSAYDVRVVTEPPAEYLPTFAVFTSDEVVPDATSYTCSSSPANCAARARDRAYFTNGGTQFCTDPDIVTSAVFAVGLMSGLEGKAGAPDDWMNYPPDFMAPPTQFLDACGTIANQLGGDDGMTPLPLQCTSLDHVGCDSGEQNSHADLLENLGPPGGDDDAPVITLLSPADGDVISPPDPLIIDFELDEASNYAGARVTIRADAFIGVFDGGEVTFCTTDLCDVNWLDGDPFKTADSGWSTGELNGLPEDEYVIEIEASDYYGNEAAMITLTVTVGDGPVDPTEGDTTGGDDTTTTGEGETGDEGGDTDPAGSTTSGGGTSGGADSGIATTGPDTGMPDPTAAGSSGSGGQASADDDLGSRGCGCSNGRDAPQGSLLLILGLLGLRRRR